MSDHPRPGDLVPLGTQPRTETGVLCLECGAWKGALAVHLPRAHAISAAEYKARHGLRQTQSLRSLSAEARGREVSRELVEDRPELVENVRTIPQAERVERSRAVRQSTAAVAAIRPGYEVSRQRQGESVGRANTDRAAKRHEALAVEHGYESWEALLRATVDESARVLGARLGLSEMPISEARRAVLGADWLDMKKNWRT